MYRIHQMVSPISNSESTNFFNQYLFSIGKLRKNSFGPNINFREKSFKKYYQILLHSNKGAPKCWFFANFCKPFRFFKETFPQFLHDQTLTRPMIFTEFSKLQPWFLRKSSVAFKIKCPKRQFFSVFKETFSQFLPDQRPWHDQS